MSDSLELEDAEPEVGEGAEGIAIVGMAGRFPGARDVGQFWHNLRDGVEAISFFTPEELEAAGVDASVYTQPNFVGAGGVLADVELFDAAYFDFTPREARLLDPQHRLFLECAVHALEHAGYDPARYGGRIAVFGGAGANYYLLGNLMRNRPLLEEIGLLQVMLANEGDFLCTRVSYKLNLRGPSALVQTACSTALSAVHLACQSLLTGECEMALAGGVNVGVPQNQGYFFQEGSILSADGHCRSFDAAATGSVAGNGLGLVVLKRLADALADGDHVHAVIRGSAMNNDGASKVGFTAPSVQCQSEVVAEALSMSGVDPETIGYIEAHGSGTALGDPIEAQALKDAFREFTERAGYCAIGSVKSSIGHLNAAAGIAGLLKTVLALEHGEIPPSLHFRQLNPEIDFAGSPFFVNDRLRPWPRLDGRRRGGVSSFGLGGTNVHAVLEEAPPAPASPPSRRHQLLLLSARSAPALDAASANLADFLASQPQLSLADAAYTLQLGRQELELRRAVVARDAEEAVAALRAEPVTARVDRDSRPVVFLFPGLGDHYVHMGRQLYEQEPTFRQHLDRCAELLEPHLGVDVRAVLFAGEPPAEQAGVAGPDLKALLRRGQPQDEASQRLNQTVHAQPALFAVQYALAQLLISWGLAPRALIGYSLGEYVAACLAGVFSLEDALLLVARRARLIAELPAGAMLAVPLPEGEVTPLLAGGELSLCATNGPNLTVAGGPPAAVAALQERLAARGVTCLQLATTHAFHSAMMAPVAAQLTELARTLELRPPAVPLLSNVTGTWLSAAEATDPGYWARHLCGTVRFAESLGELLQDPRRLLFEVGPGNALGTLVKQHPRVAAEQVVISTLRHASDRGADQAHLLRAVGHAWLAGAKVDWAGFYAHEQRRRAVLPGYPFERRRFWIEPGSDPRGSELRTAGGELHEGGKAPLQDWFYVPSWRQTAARLPAAGATPESAIEATRWLLLVDEGGLGAELAERLRAAGHEVFTAEPGAAFRGPDPGDPRHSGFVLQPERKEDYLRMLREIAESGELPSRVLHLWNLTATPAPSFDAAQERGLYSLLAFAQAVAELGAAVPLRLGMVANRLHDVAGGEPVEVEKATLLGACRVLPQELAATAVVCLDVVLPPPATAARRRLADQLLIELRLPPGRRDPLWSQQGIAYRGPHRWVQGFERVPQGPAGEPSPRLRRQGVYLITDGTTQLGLELAELLLRDFQVRLTVLVPADWPPADAGEPQQAVARRLEQLRALGGELEVLSAELTDAGALASLLAGVRQRRGALHGVIHSATAFAGGLIQLKTPQALTAVNGRLGRGALALDAALDAEALAGAPPLDFVLLCSAATAVTGGLGQVDLCAAGALLDALADRRVAAGDGATTTLAWGSFAWDQWLLPGTMGGAALQQQVQENLQRFGITAAECGEVFRRALASGLPRLVLSTQELAVVIEQTAAMTAESLLLEAAKGTELHPRGELSTPYEEPGDELEEGLAEIWSRLFGIDRVGIRDNFFELGGYSLLGIQMVTQIRQRFGAEIVITELFDTPTIAGLAGRIRGQKQPVELGEDELARLLSQVEGMSPEEMAALLAAEGASQP